MTLREVLKRSPTCYRPLRSPALLRMAFLHPEKWNRLKENDWGGMLECWIRYVARSDGTFHEQLIWLPDGIAPSDYGLD